VKPTSNTAWPPAEFASVLNPMREWATWYEGDPDQLAAIYGKSSSVRPSQQASGVVGRVARWFWGQPVPAGQSKARTHIPIARDIARVSARLLFGEQLTIKAGDSEDQQLARLHQILDDNHFEQRLVEAAEFCAALGGVWWRVSWDTTVAKYPLLSIVQADAAFPTFSYGRLRDVTFVQVVKVEGPTVWRHFETHTAGYVTHELYQGTQSSVGTIVPLAETLQTADLPVNELSQIETGVPMVAAVYVPNVRPVPRWRNDPNGQELGASDFDGIEGSFDELDEAWTNLRREGRLNKSRIIAASGLLENLGPGVGAAFDSDREVFTPVQAPADVAGLPITLAPSTLTVADRLAEIEALMRRIYSDAGYSPETFGLGSAGTALTATEVAARERKSMTTREAKTRTWTNALEDLLELVSALDAKLFGGTAIRPTVEFAASVSPTLAEIASSVQALNAAQAASVETRVKMVHPDWADTQIQEEVARIQAENAMTTPTINLDPMTDPNAAPTDAISSADEIKAKADAMGVLIRAGVENDSAAAQVGLPGVNFRPGATPITIKLPGSDSTSA